MARGPAPKSAAEKRARGNPGKRSIREPSIAPGVVVGDAKPDANLRPVARNVWNRLAPELHRLNVLRATDSTALSRYCEDVARYWEVTSKLRKEGETYQVESNHGSYRRINPLVAIQDRIAARLVALEDRFGLSPQARQSIMIRAAQIATQGTLPFGPAEQDDRTKPDAPPPPPDNPIGLLNAVTRH